MHAIEYIDRKSGKRCREEVYGDEYLKFLYGNSNASHWVAPLILPLVATTSLFSRLYGFFQGLPVSKRKIAPFIEKFQVDTTEFQEDPSTFSSFNDFFTRKLKPEARPIDPSPDTAVIPADGRYLFYQNLDKADGFVVKGKKFDIKKLLHDNSLAKSYLHGSLVLARLCPSDYHRYHFPCDGIPQPSCSIDGYWYSVNPIAIKNRIEIFCENKRRYCVYDTERFGKVTIVEVGATCVGSIHETYTPLKPAFKGDEMGYFSFGGSSLILLFPKNTIEFDPDLVKASASHTEIRCLMGQSMGKAAKLS
jgi:phosphatidylserine decarboxylase